MVEVQMKPRPVGCFRFAGSVCLLLSTALPLCGQELEPRAYSISPVGVNVIVLTNNLLGGDVTFAPTLPVEDARATINTTGLAYVRSINFLGRSSNIGAALPFTAGNLQGIYIGEFTKVSRAGLSDLGIRFAVNLHGAPAMNLKEFAAYRQKTNIGVSLVVKAPLGEYDPTKLINIGTNRWSFKPELGLSKAIGKWTLEIYAGVWLFTDNTNFLGQYTREQDPIGSGQIHILYTIKPQLWVAFDSNFYTGGRTTVNGTVNLDLQRNSRVGGTVAIPLNRRHSLKIAYSRGAFTTIGADFQALAVGWQYLWGAGL
jgi:hypothetical protein